MASAIVDGISVLLGPTYAVVGPFTYTFTGHQAPIVMAVDGHRTPHTVLWNNRVPSLPPLSYAYVDMKRSIVYLPSGSLLRWCHGSGDDSTAGFAN